MSYLFDQARIKRQNLEKVRQSFLLLTSDGQYPPERQQRLYQATTKLGLDWNEARQFMRPEAEAYFQRYLATLATQRNLVPEDTAELNLLRRRLALDVHIIDQEPPPDPPVRRAWSDIKAAMAVVLLVPFVWLGLGVLTTFGLGIAGGLIGMRLVNMLMPLMMLVNFFLAIRITVRRVRRWRGDTRSPANPPAPSNTPPLPPVPPLPLPPVPPYPGPTLLFTGVMLFNQVQGLTGSEFEQWVSAQLRELGWTDLKVMGGRGDRGVDIRGTYQGKKCIVQCKHYPGRLIPPNEVRALVGTRTIQRAQRAYLLTSGQFGYQCFQEAHNRPVELWDLETLATHLNNYRLVRVA